MFYFPTMTLQFYFLSITPETYYNHISFNIRGVLLERDFEEVRSSFSLFEKTFFVFSFSH